MLEKALLSYNYLSYIKKLLKNIIAQIIHKNVSYRRKQNRSVVFRHSTPMPPEIRRKVRTGRVLIGTEYFNTRFPDFLYLAYCVRDKM